MVFNAVTQADLYKNATCNCIKKEATLFVPAELFLHNYSLWVPRKIYSSFTKLVQSLSCHCSVVVIYAIFKLSLMQIILVKVTGGFQFSP